MPLTHPSPAHTGGCCPRAQGLGFGYGLGVRVQVEAPHTHAHIHTHTHRRLLPKDLVTKFGHDDRQKFSNVCSTFYREHVLLKKFNIY